MAGHEFEYAGDYSSFQMVERAPRGHLRPVVIGGPGSRQENAAASEFWTKLANDLNSYSHYDHETAKQLIKEAQEYAEDEKILENLGREFPDPSPTVIVPNPPLNKATWDKFMEALDRGDYNDPVNIPVFPAPISVRAKRAEAEPMPPQLPQERTTPSAASPRTVDPGEAPRRIVEL